MLKRPSETTSIIEFNNVGAVVYREVPVPPEGGVVVLKGRNGSGKSTLLRAGRALCGAKVALEKHDSAEKGSVEGLGSKVTIAKQQRRSGDKPDRLEVAHVEDQFDMHLVVDPGVKDPVAADAVRVKSLAKLCGKEIPMQRFAALLNGDAEAAALVERARDEADPVARALLVKRILQQMACELEGQASETEERKRALQAAIEGVDLKNAPDFDAANELLTENVRSLSSAEEKRQAALDRSKARAEAQKALEAARASYKGISSNEAAQSVATAQEGRRQALKELERAKEQLAKAESCLDRAVDVHEAAAQHEETLVQWEAAVNQPADEPPSEHEIERRRHAVVTARAAVSMAIAARDARPKAQEAAQLRTKAEAAKARAAMLRDAAKQAEALIAEAIDVPQLSFKGERLVYARDGGEELFDRLSRGEKYTVAVAAGAKGVGEMGDKTGLLILDQEAWEGLDPTNRDVLDDLARVYGVVVLTAEAAEGELRAEIYGQD